MTSPRRGRRPGPLPRGTCPVCGDEYAVRANGGMGQHKRKNARGYRMGNCPGVNQPPRDQP